MKKIYFLIFAIAISIFAQAQTATQPSGDGSESNPYQIATLDNLYWLSHTDSIWDDTLYFNQTADIDASDSKSWNGNSGFLPIGIEDSPFIGHYNGKGYSISNLYSNYESTSYIGFFGRTAASTIDSLVLKNISITGYSYVGALVGKAGGTTIQNCYIQNGTVYSPGRFAGGLVGIVVNSTIKNCYVTGKVKGSGYTGGIIGRFYKGSMHNCYAVCDINSIGGQRVGGISGSLEAIATIYNCYSFCNVKGYEFVGGIVGRKEAGTLINCYTVSTVSGSSEVNACVGSLVSGEADTSCYYNSDVTSLNDFIGVSLTTNEMKDAANFIGFNFDTAWTIRENKTYPALLEINNAPFAFPDTITGGLADVLRNDYDYETLQNNLTYTLESVVSLKTSTDYTNDIGSIPDADSLEVTYRIGEVLQEADTLWGNKATSYVLIGNSSPIIKSTAPTTAELGSEYTYTIEAIDNNGDNLTYALSNAPSGMSISDNVISWTPTSGTTTSGEITLTVSDGSLNSSENFSITVLNPPVISSTAPTTALVGTEYTYTIAATDANEDNLTYSLSNAPDGMTISENVITWTPVSGTTTSAEVTLTVSDGTLNATEQFTIAVTEDNSNVAPEITSTAPTTATVGSEYTYTIVATDADGDDLTYTLSNAPDGMSISENVITWTPVSGTTTSAEVTLTVSDGSLSTTEQFTIAVSENSGTSVVNVTNENISLYPNPVSSVLTIKNNNSIETIQVFSVSGSVVLSQTVNNTETGLDMQSLQNGIYLLQINTSEGSIIKRIVKQ